MNEQPFELIAKTFQGLEEVLAQELTALGADEIEIGRRMVSFKGDKEMMYRANFSLRTALRVLKPIKHFTAQTADEVYEQVKDICWEDYLPEDKTFAVDAVVFSEEFRHSKFVAYRVKDAIADYFREKTGRRPSVSVTRPDVQINIHIAETACTLSLDSSGESLHRRGYRQEAVEAPLNEVLAAGIILMTGWNGQCDLIDPMCGSGTIPVEAALIARNIAPGVFRQGYAFEQWPDFDADLFERIYNDDSRERDFAHKIYAYDNNPRAIEIATRNLKAAGVSKDVELKLQPFQQFTQPKKKSVLITNPPYGERISSDDLLGLYEMIGERLKHAFTGGTAWILSYRDECFDQIGLKATVRIPLLNGALPCELREYEIFDGKYPDFRREGGRLDKSMKNEESRMKNEGFRRKPKGNSSFGDEADILHSSLKRDRKPRFDDRPRRDDRDERRPFRSDDRKPRFDDRPRRNEELRMKNKEFRGKPEGNSSFRPEGTIPHSSFKNDRRPRSGESYPERKRREARERGEKKGE